MSSEIQKIDQFKIQLADNSKAIKSMLPEHVSLEKFQRITYTAIQKTPSLAGKPGLLGAVLDCARDGLIPDGREAALVPFKGDVAYMPMTAGILKKIRNSGELKSLSANVIYKSDQFSYSVDENGPHFSHSPNILAEDQGEIIGAYAVAITKNDGKYFELLKKSDIEKIRNSSSAKNGGPWSNWYDEMAKKSAIRRLSKRLPMSSDIEDVIRRDDKFHEFDSINVEPEPKKEPVKKGSSSNDLTKKLKAAKPAVKIGAKPTKQVEKMIKKEEPKKTPEPQGPELEIF